MFLQIAASVALAVLLTSVFFLRREAITVLKCYQGSLSEDEDRFLMMMEQFSVPVSRESPSHIDSRWFALSATREQVIIARLLHLGFIEVIPCEFKDRTRYQLTERGRRLLAARHELNRLLVCREGYFSHQNLQEFGLAMVWLGVDGSEILVTQVTIDGPSNQPGAVHVGRVERFLRRASVEDRRTLLLSQSSHRAP